ncbi:MAG TPA: carbohydrate kinase family protein [Euryarchaeota archaeon]|nr:carbohydrate kinase family protein [Euryarchaeota archaeon]
MIAVVGNIALDILVGLLELPKSNYVKVEGEELIISGGGSAANVAYWLGRFGEKVVLLGCVGKDKFGEYILEDLKNVGVDTSKVIKVNSPSNIALILTGRGFKVMIRVRKASKLCELDVQCIKDADYIHFGSNTLHILKRYKNNLKGKKVSYDPGPDKPKIDDISDLWIFSPNEQEAKNIFGKDLTKSIKDCPIEILAIKMLDGSVLYCYEGKIRTVKPLKVPVVDTTGSGDAFDAALIFGLKNGLDVYDAITFAKGIASLNSMVLGTRNYNFSLEKLINVLKDNNVLSKELEAFIWERLMKDISK